MDYRQSKFEDVAREMDVVFDTVGGETLERSWSVLKPSGRMVTIASTGDQATDARTKQAFFIVEPNQKQLFGISERLESGGLRTCVDGVVPLAEAPEAYAGKLSRRGRGKVVVAVAGTD